MRAIYIGETCKYLKRFKIYEYTKKGEFEYLVCDEYFLENITGTLFRNSEDFKEEFVEIE